MRFSLSLDFVLRHMGNEYDEEIQDIDEDGTLVWELIKMLLHRELEFEIDDDGFLVLEVPDELLGVEG